MQETKKTSLENLDKAPLYQQYAPLKIEVAKPFEHKEIDTRWIQLKLGGKFTSRSYFASCIQAGKVYIHGGYNEEKGIIDDFIQAQFYDLPSQWNQIKVRSVKNKNPPGLRNHTLCPYTSNLVLFGGQKSMLQNSNKFYRFDMRTGQWQALKVIFQENKKFHLSLDSHIAQIHNDCMYIFGGYESEIGTYSNTIYEVKLKNINNNEIIISQVQVATEKPLPRGNLSSCIVDNRLYIFGGTNSDLIFDDLWFFDFEKLKWTEIKKPSKQEGIWPEKRKGHVMVSHGATKTIFIFGGIRQITKQQNDIMVFSVKKEKWVRIHKNTNELYEPSPTFKKLEETSPSIINAKNRKNQKKTDENPFKLGLKSVTAYNNNSKSTPQNPEPNFGSYKPYLTGSEGFGTQKTDFADKKQLSVVQEKKIRQFMMKKKKLLSEVTKAEKSIQKSKKRLHSPTSESLIYSIDSIGEQKKYPENFQNELPKVIFDEQKGAVTGKKPCARDGHAGLTYENNMIIIGGDRHMISFSDVYLFKIDKAIKNIHIYE